MEDVLPYYLSIGVSYERFMDSCPEELKPFRTAEKIGIYRRDEELWRLGGYVLSAVQTAVANVLIGRKSKVKYIDEPLTKTAERKYKFEHLSENDKIYYTKLLFKKLEGMKNKFEKTKLKEDGGEA